ncbi:ankyrin repeat protein [Ectocarpus siliculosus]|uniref:Ankyrin repeat protein n=1 Tax=Ectocarpus siliculosus TaxID=2880 RepID=D7FY93_ECTSI|nr:ankyrin repeat protein [Ectocarpus siliculosus]|eukprot:CBJ26532.1 ankyrin repeat protein [Ectocarpus siliculosus]
MGLREAINRGEEKLACKLVYSGADPNEHFVKNRTGYDCHEVERYETPLTLAASYRLETLTMVLLLKGARVDLDHNKYTLQESPLMHAVWTDHEEGINAFLIRILLQAHVDNEDEAVPFTDANVDVPFAMRFVLRHSDWFDDAEEFHEAVWTIAELKPGVINADVGLGWRPLTLVQDRGAMEILLRPGADPKDIGCLLECHCSGGCIDARDARDTGVIQGCLECGADPNAKDKNGDTLLIIAVHNGFDSSENAKVVDVLLRGGADETIIGNGGMTALDWAREEEQRDTISLLVNAARDRSRRRRLLIIMCIRRGTGVAANSSWGRVAEFLVDLRGNPGTEGIFRTVFGFM